MYLFTNQTLSVSFIFFNTVKNDKHKILTIRLAIILLSEINFI